MTRSANRFVAAALVSVAAGAAAGFAAPASAQERAPFTGPRVELLSGYDKTEGGRPSAGAPNKIDGIYVAGAAGYDLALGSKVRLGAEAGIGFDVNDEVSGGTGANSYRLSSGRDIDLSLRLGVLASPSTLLYAKAGWANSRYSARVGTGSTALRASTDENGLRLGAGVEHMLGEHAYLKGEYRYTSYGQGVDRHQLLAGVGYRF